MSRYLIFCKRHDLDGIATYFLDSTRTPFNEDEVGAINWKNYYKTEAAVREDIFDLENRNALDQMRHLPGVVPYVEFEPFEV